ncbi:FAM183A and FAM183B related [Plasmodiophora brassicae]|uniref:Uncharacterized protein n=1 Tax=Plasmodiophora brassicae TaxID=37360 RepID=A0A0G4IM84_PLABS|nr:hypothetical protein PBRA_004873 [Plasmodiophora brassicae]SPQ99135.1 unnamed protein product [Plasmodiophora brassicae]
MAEAAAAAKRGTDPVARNAVWSEHIRRELATQKINTTFTINASKMSVITPKPNTQVPEGRRAENLDNDPVAQQVRDGLRRADLPPMRRLPQGPQTTSQEYGWDRRLSSEVKRSSPMLTSRFNRPRQTCPITSYAERYIVSNGKSPFARPDHQTAAKPK